MGFLDEASGTTDANKSIVSDYFATWDSKYLTAPLDTDTSNIEFELETSGYSGCMLNTSDFKDPWGNEYRLYYLVANVGDVYNYRIVLASAGPNSTFAPDAANAYFGKAYDDDIVMVMEPRS